ncbi:pseudaminic acid synthase [Rhodobacteraceae bacterium N5(2021)]|uniref:Pseudaminic acid synthase n=1 Tax=Gymnodinialimonas phycosphaerae TaxID=2841589 RepID=A0A975YEC3_9RHOB|nr:pseudaminic acid synthase [Gymnodinialimonas phycosphaerae]MBY4893446.1 pseudaminic acid synthase [Gymnodinialimonas phycosphaerae]
MAPEIQIDGRKIGADHPPYVICELSGNHIGSLDRALAMIEEAAKTGCAAIKLQTYTADTLTIDSDKPDFRINGGLWDGRTLYDLYQEAHTPFEWHEAMFAKAAEVGVTLFSTPFDETAADLLEDLGAPAYKIASFEAVHLPLIAHVARKGKPMIISTGLANLAEIEAAVRTARDNGCEELVLLHCISSYPAPSDQSNLRTMPHLAEMFGAVPGLSDHTMGSATSVAAIALGGAVIEKHFTMARADGGPDADFSLEPDEFTRLVDDCHNAWLSLGQVGYNTKSAEEGNVVFRRSLYAVRDITAGEAFTPDNVRVIRPGYGLPPRHYDRVIGAEATQAIERGTALSWSMVR